MFRRPHKEYTDEKEVERQNVHWLVIMGDEGQWKHDWYNVSKEVLYGCRVETRKGNRRGKAVMELMVASVEQGVVKQAVDVVCQDFAC